jgi:nicotinamidase-related amidase
MGFVENAIRVVVFAGFLALVKHFLGIDTVIIVGLATILAVLPYRE